MKCNSKKIVGVLSKIYFNPKEPGSFGGIDGLLRQARKKTPCAISRDFVSKWLHSMPAYSLHKVARRNFPRLRVITKGPDEQWQADLVDFVAFKKANEDYRYLLVVVDVFSRYCFVEKLKTKSGKEVSAAFKSIFTKAGRAPKKLQTDRGTEFYNDQVGALLKTRGVELFSTQTEIKAANVERLNLTLESKLHRFFTYRTTRRWIDVIDDIVQSYNNSPHRSLGFNTPASVTHANVEEMRGIIYKKNKLVNFLKRLPKVVLSVGDLVRQSVVKKEFEKGASQKWTVEIYRVREKQVTDDGTVYLLEDLKSEPLQGRYYPWELQKVPKDSREDGPVQVLERKGNRVRVHWIGWHSKFDTWIPKRNVKNV